MGPNSNPAPQPQTPTKPERGEFLALRLIAAVGLTVVLTLAAAGTISHFIELLAGTQNSLLGAVLSGLLQETSIVTGTMLISLAVLPWLLFRSVKASLASEPKFTDRTVYKVTMYGGLALLVIATSLNLIGALAAVVGSLLSIGVEHADIGGIYLHKFLPSLLAAVVTGFIAFCLLQTARGRDKINLMSLVLAIVSVAFGVALLIAVAVTLHRELSQGESLTPTTPGNSLDNPSFDLDEDSSSDSKDFSF